MEYSEEEKLIVDAAVKWARKKANKRLVLDHYFAEADSQRTANPLVFFMAGSPGAGKTEVSKALVSGINEEPESLYYRIDPDEIREFFFECGYNGQNAYLFQRAVSVLMYDLMSAICRLRVNALVDGTLANYAIAKENIRKTIEANGLAGIVYVYQDPMLAWRFTQEREAVEGRRIGKEAFINAFFAAHDNVRLLKQEFKDKLVVMLVVKDYRHAVKLLKFGVEDVDKYVKIDYKSEDLKEKLDEQ